MSEKDIENKNISSTPYDDVFRTMINDCTRFVLPLLNEVFGEHYDGTEKIIMANDYHFKNMQDGIEDKIITDSSFKVIQGKVEKKYHLECQSTIDNSMALRFFEYDSQIALDDAIIESVNDGDKDNEKSCIKGSGKSSNYNTGTLILTFPHSAVLFLRSNSNTADAMKLKFITPGGEVSYDIPVIKMQRYSLKEIWEKKFYMLIPFYIFTHEANFNQYSNDDILLQNLIDEFVWIRRQLKKLTHERKITEFENRTIVELSKKVVDSIARKYKKITEGVDKVMGGKVIETEAKRIFNRGISQGKLDLIKKKLAKGKGIAQIADELEETEEVILKLIEQMNQPVD